MVTYGGDEVNALVLDIGSTTTRAGYAGEDAPRVTMPTSYGVRDAQPAAADGDVAMQEANDTNAMKTYYFGDEKVNARIPGMEIKNPMSEGLVSDWDAMEQLWADTFRSRLRIDTTEHPLFCTDPAWNPKENREKMAELAFEKFDFPAFYVGRDAVMTAYSHGRATALVLDSGSTTTSIVPVYDGHVLEKGIQKQMFGGDNITERILEKLRAELGDRELHPEYKIKSKKFTADQSVKIEYHNCTGITQSFHDFQVSRMIHNFKESICQVPDSDTDKTFEFPDGFGFNRPFGSEYFSLPGDMFSPSQPEGLYSIQDLVAKSLDSCDVDLRPLLMNNIVTAGGNTLFSGFKDRLYNELSHKLRQQKIKLDSSEHKGPSWLGGSILASLGTFHQLWISKKEYEEVGSSVAWKKCQ